MILIAVAGFFVPQVAVIVAVVAAAAAARTVVVVAFAVVFGSLVQQ